MGEPAVDSVTNTGGVSLCHRPLHQSETVPSPDTADQSEPSVPGGRRMGEMWTSEECHQTGQVTTRATNQRFFSLSNIINKRAGGLVSAPHLSSISEFQWP